MLRRAQGRGGTRTRRALVALTAAAVVVALGMVASADRLKARGTPAGPPQNVIVVMTDDMTTSQLRYMPQTREAVRAKGVRYSRHFAVQPVCCPSRATFLTGQYPHNHGVRGNAPPLGGYEGLPTNTLNQWVQEAGYRTAWVGKFLNGYGARDNPKREVPPGWDKWVGMVASKSYYDYTLNVNGNLRRYGSKSSDYLTDVLAERSARTIEGTEEPLFMVVAPRAPHNDGGTTGMAIPADRHLGALHDERLPSRHAFRDDLSDKPAWVSEAAGTADRPFAVERWRRALESLLAVDDLVGRLREALRAEGELSETVLIVTSDNGMMHGEHSLMKKNVPYEPAVSVPLVIRGDGFEVGGTDSRLTGNIDLAPTIVDLTGAQPGVVMDGRSLLAPGSRRRLLIEGGKGEALPPVWSGLRTADAMYAEYGTGDAELYDMSTDFQQLTNVAGRPRYSALEARLATELEAVRNCAGASCP